VRCSPAVFLGQGGGSLPRPLCDEGCGVGDHQSPAEIIPFNFESLRVYSDTLALLPFATDRAPNPQSEITFMNTPQPTQTRREFLSEVGKGMVTAAVGYSLAHELGLSSAYAEDIETRLEFGALEPLVQLMQDTPAPKLLPILVEKLRTGTELRQLVAAGAFANARAFVGEDYVGFPQ
jgi:hypothetical protein